MEEDITDGNIFVNTVQENMMRYSKRDVKKATEARRFHGTLHLPSKQKFDWMIRSNQIKNCKAMPDHAEIAHDVWGESEDYIKGSRVQIKSKHVDGFKLKVPTKYFKLGKEVYLTCDVFFVNKIHFFITLSRKIDFTATAHLKDQKIKTIFLAFLAVYKFYLRRGFRIKMVHADNEFGPMKPLIK